jgi:predicted GNAT family acetyltransferase
MPESDPPIRVIDNPEKHRYEAYVGEELAGFVTYLSRSGAVVLVHTEVASAFEGHGIGGRLAAGALKDIRARALQVVPLCPFIAGYIDRHPELSDLVADEGSPLGA